MPVIYRVKLMKNIKIWASVLGLAAGTFGTVPGALAADRPDQVEKQDMRQAIAFERHKEEAAARQARAERRGGSEKARRERESKSSADRSMAPDRKDGKGRAGSPPVNR